MRTGNGSAVMGRPTKYRPEHCSTVKACGAKGWSRAMIARELDICFETLRNWEREYPDFLEAMQRAKELSLAWWDHAGQEGIFLKTFNANAYRLQVTNRFPEHYRDRREVRQTGSVEHTVRAMSDAELLERGKQLARYFEASGNGKEKLAQLPPPREIVQD